MKYLPTTLGAVVAATVLFSACSAETEAAEDEPTTGTETYEEPSVDELDVPSQDELDAAAEESIDASDLDAELEKLRGELGEDG